ncbi:hypothetical protein Nm8I071_43790 [Nonomuraea sp. TT08I-71]|nr:hypothetical protein Nm8I071_43790 [Nonomuraea sp. TT08I-71]
MSPQWMPEQVHGLLARVEQILQPAEEQADDHRAGARSEAEAIVTAARREAEAILNRAEDQAAGITGTRAGPAAGTAQPGAVAG